MYDVITVGTATRDVFLPSKGIKTLKDPEHLRSLGFEEGEAKCFAMGAKIDIDEPIFSTGGGATNAAVTFSRQGFKAAAAITVGKDESAAAIITALKQDKVKPLTSISKEHGTAYSTLLLTPDGERTILVYRGASNDLDLKQIPLRKLRSRWLYIVPGAIAFETINTIIAQAKKAGARIAMNPSSHYLDMGVATLAPLLNQLDVLTMNRGEAAELTGVSYVDEQGLFARLNELTKGIVVMSEGPKGVLVSDGTIRLRAGIFSERQVADRTGAGDAFGSGFVAGLMRTNRKADSYTEDELRTAIRLASANATSVVEHVSAKTGILTKTQFADARWQELNIEQF